MFELNFENMKAKRRDSESSPEEEVEREETEAPLERQDLYVVFTNERELRSIDQVRIKISQFTGVVMRCRNVTTQAMENLLMAIEADAANFQQLQQSKPPVPPMMKLKSAKMGPNEMTGLSEAAPQMTQTPSSGIVNLRFEDCIFTTKAIQLLKAFLSQKPLVETVCIQKAEFQNPVSDFRAFCEGMQFSNKVRKVSILGMVFDEEPYGKILSHLLNDCRQLREFDCSGCEFYHPKCFFDMCQSFIGEKCRVNVFKCKSVMISNLEGKVMQFVLMKNKSLHTIDFSGCRLEAAEHLEYFIQKINKDSNIRYLVLDNIQPDLSGCLEIMGETFSENQRLEVLIMRENKLKWVPYANFWENIQNNTSLLKINVSKTDLSDRVLEKLCLYLQNPNVKLMDLDLSRNSITDLGVQHLAETLTSNHTVKYLNLGSNLIRDVGLRSLVAWLAHDKCVLQELSLQGNKINNEGIHILSEFVKPNTSLKMLDISRNLYGDASFSAFAQEMGMYATLTFLDISKTKELSDEGSLITLAKQLAFNTHLQTLDLSGVRIRKPFLKLYLEPSLKQNITLKYVLGKFTPDVIDEQLETNIKIQTDVEPNYTAVVKGNQPGLFDVSLVDAACNSRLTMANANANLFDAAFKFVQKLDVRTVDLSGMNLQDGQMYLLASYLKDGPNLRSLILDNNPLITDDGLNRISNALSVNTKLAQLSFQKCKSLTNETLSQILKVITEDNMMLCSIEFDEATKQFDQEIASQIRHEAKLNYWLQEHLKPQCLGSSNQTKKSTTSLISNEVIFKEGASIAKYLQSAIKCWRITRPSIIQIENQELGDAHIHQLTKFLKGRNMIKTLNLRRNKISNVGSMYLIDWMLNFDTKLTSLDVSRNKITRKGAQAFLDALKKLTRIQEFQITYGNPIPLDINLAIQQEIIANNQIEKNQKESHLINHQSKMSLSQGRYELIDRGPLYMRCAIKSVELLKICHLSLPDNMLGFEEAKMLAAMIELDPPLKTLNLETNNLDAACAKLIADALAKNSNLLSLNLARNKLSDLGINCIVQTLIRARFKELEQPEMYSVQDADAQATARAKTMKKRKSTKITLQIQSTQRNPLKKTEEQNGESIVDERIKTEEIEKCLFGQLKILNIFENLATLESYKAIKTLQEINQSIVIYFDSPMKMQMALKSTRLLLQQRSKYARVPSTEELTNLSIQDVSLVDSFAENRIKPSPDFIEDGTMDEMDESAAMEAVQKQAKSFAVKQPPQKPKDCRSKIKHQEQRLLSFIAKLTCYYNYQKGKSEGRTLSFRKVLFWRVMVWKNEALTFDFTKNVRLFNRRQLQNIISIMIVANQALMYLFVFSPYFLNIELATLFVLCFAGYLFLFELVLLIISKVYVQSSLCNPYLGLQMFSGFLKKCCFLAFGLIAGLSAPDEKNFVIEWVDWVGFLALFIDQFKTVQLMLKGGELDQSTVLPYLERSQRLAEACLYQGLTIQYRKSSLLPTKEAKFSAERIAVDLNPDLMKPPVVGLIPRTWDKLKDIYSHDLILKHFLFIDIVFLACAVVHFFIDWSELNQVILSFLIVLALDSISCLFEMTEKQNEVSLQAMAVFAVSGKRNLELGSAYTAVLNREQQQDSDYCLTSQESNILDEDERNQTRNHDDISFRAKSELQLGHRTKTTFSPDLTVIKDNIESNSAR